MCNNSGIITCVFCSNFVIEGIIWDQLGNTNPPDYTHGIGFVYASNLTIVSSTFQYSGVCSVVMLSVASGYVQVLNSSFLYNHIVNSSKCKLYNSLYIQIDDSYGTQSIHIIHIVGTVFHHNGLFNNTNHHYNEKLF